MFEFQDETETQSVHTSFNGLMRQQRKIRRKLNVSSVKKL